MVTLNKYLKEIGINEKYWLFDKDNKEFDDRYKPDKEGFVDAEFFCLDTSLSLYIYSQLCYFRENCLCSSPMGMTKKEWNEILNKIIESFKLMIVEDPKEFYEANDKRKKILSKNRQKKINYGLRLFIKYYHNLWY